MQRPITVFIHHNTLHAFEHQNFHAAVRAAAERFNCQPYLPEQEFREQFALGRFTQSDLAAALLDMLDADADQLIGIMGTRFHLRLAMLEHPLPQGSDAELRWCIAETEALHAFRPEAPPRIRQRMIDETRRWMMRDLRSAESSAAGDLQELFGRVCEEFEASSAERWPPSTWEAFTLHLLWHVCERGVQPIDVVGPPPPVRHRDLLLHSTGVDTDAVVHPVLIRCCAAFLDQGFAHWFLPHRDTGFLEAFGRLYRDARPVEPWMRGLPEVLRRWEQTKLSALELVEESLAELGVAEDECEEYVTQTLLALRGWAGMMQQMESNAGWCPYPAPPGALLEFLAVRLLLERLALQDAARRLPGNVSLLRLRQCLREAYRSPPRTSALRRAFAVFQLAQVRGWTPRDLQGLSREDWSRLVGEIDAFDGDERRQVYHMAYERAFWNRSLDAVAAHIRGRELRTPWPPPEGQSPTAAYQVVCCIDEREESFRRHLEEIDPECETLSVAGFFGVAMYYRGATEAHYHPLCPIVVTPRHFIREVAAQTAHETVRRQARTRRVLGQAAHVVHLGSRTMLGGWLTTLTGSIATLPLIARILFPRLTSRIRARFGRLVMPAHTTLRIERAAGDPGPEDGQLGYTLEEMAGIVGGTLRAMGLTRRFSSLVIITGHGSYSLNNPHESAHDCGACGGGRGGPNARAFSQMANDPRVRTMLAARGLEIPEEVHFLGAYHNTCDDLVTYFDVDRIPTGHQETFARARRAIDKARRRDAHERCRRFESATFALSREAALRHVENRAADLSQVRPEYGHATNALCFVGRREWSRGLYLDRRAFLTSYDPRQDDANASILRGILRAVIPVCAGISLEYYFSRVDARGYGCGTKLPHNITSLLGVMDGAASDLRPGLPWQMVEIHEPVRILFVIESTPAAMLPLIEEEAEIRRLVEQEWVRIAVLDAQTAELRVYRHGRFEPYEPNSLTLPTASASRDWYRGQRDHLGFATIVAAHDPHPEAD